MQINWNFIVQEAKLRRKEANVTQNRLADLIGISTPTVSRFERGNKNIEMSSALKILKWLGMIDDSKKDLCSND